MTITTTIGKTYAITPTVDCIISTPDGATIATCPAGQQTTIVAPTVQIQISDDNALVTETFKGASAGSSAAGGASIGQADLTDTPEQTTLDNSECYGIAIVASIAGKLKSVTLQARVNRTVSGTPVYLKIWKGSTKQLLATSTTKAAQVLDQPTTWTFPPIDIETGDQLFITAHAEAEKELSTYKTGEPLSLRVTANSKPGTGLLGEGGNISTTNWINLYTVTYKGGGKTTVNGVELAGQKDLDAHIQDNIRHITDDERTAWNNKADASALASKVNTSTFNAHTGNTTVHITGTERTAWNQKLNASVITSAQYNDLATKEPNTLYYLTDTKKLYLADTLLEIGGAVDLSNYRGQVHIQDTLGHTILRNDSGQLYVGSNYFCTHICSAMLGIEAETINLYGNIWAQDVNGNQTIIACGSGITIGNPYGYSNVEIYGYCGSGCGGADLSNYQGPIHLQDERGRIVLVTNYCGHDVWIGDAGYPSKIGVYGESIALGYSSDGNINTLFAGSSCVIEIGNNSSSAPPVNIYGLCS